MRPYKLDLYIFLIVLFWVIAWDNLRFGPAPSTPQLTFYPLKTYSKELLSS